MKKRRAASPHAKAERHLKRADPVLASVIQTVGPCQLIRRGGRFEILARSIVSQQISTAAAATIFRRLKALLPGARLSATAIRGVTDDQLQSVGLSAQKRKYLRDLTEKTLDGTVNFRALPRLSDDLVIEALTQVKGVGVWTAQMFLLAGLGRPDIFATGDLGLQNAMIDLYGIERSEEEMNRIADAWKPWRSVASWYLWSHLDQ